MKAKFDPQPIKREDGGTDHRKDGCPNICYWDDAEGAYVGQCPRLKVSVEGLECLEDEDDC